MAVFVLKRDVKLQPTKQPAMIAFTLGSNGPLFTNYRFQYIYYVEAISGACKSHLLWIAFACDKRAENKQHLQLAIMQVAYARRL